MQSLVMTWPGGEHPFRLALAQLESVQQKTECGPEWLLMKVQSGQWSAVDLFEVIRFGLIGGGMDDAEARRLSTAAFDRHPLVSFKPVAQAVLLAALYGPPDDEVGKPLPAGDPTPTVFPEESGGSAATTA